MTVISPPSEPTWIRRAGQWHGLKDRLCQCRRRLNMRMQGSLSWSHSHITTTYRQHRRYILPAITQVVRGSNFGSLFDSGISLGYTEGVIMVEHAQKGYSRR